MLFIQKSDNRQEIDLLPVIHGNYRRLQIPFEDLCVSFLNATYIVSSVPSWNTNKPISRSLLSFLEAVSANLMLVTNNHNLIVSAAVIEFLSNKD